MRGKRQMLAGLAAIATCMVFAGGAHAVPLTTAFTYQGDLILGGTPVTDTCDFEFTLWTAAAAGAQVGPTLTFSGGSAIAVVDGIFKVELDFGAAPLNGERRWLQIRVACPTGKPFVLLSPRQELTGTPYALQTRGLFVDDALNVGIGTTTPTGKVNIAGGEVHVDWAGDRAYRIGNNGGPEGLLALTENTTTAGLTTALGTSQLSDGSGFFQALTRTGVRVAQLWADTDASDNGVSPAQFFIRSLGGGPGGEISVRNDTDVETIELLGGPASSEGTVTLFNTGTGAPTVGLEGDASGMGGRIYTQSEDGNRQATIEPDFNGEGVFVALRRSNGSTGLSFDGNTSGSLNPSLSLSSTVSPMSFNTNSTDSASVSLPTNAIQDTEILDEPGVASATVPTASTTLSTNSTVVNLLSRTITVPTSGFVLVIGTLQPQYSHVAGTQDIYDFGVSDVSNAFPANQDFALTTGTGASSSFYSRVVTVHGLFSVATGSNTFYLLGRKNSGANVDVFDRQLSLLFVPTAYGTVTPTPPDLAGTAGDDHAVAAAPLTAEDVAAEQAEAKAFNQARLDGELAEMRTQVEALQERLAQVEAEQASVQPARPSSSSNDADPSGG